MEMSLVKEPVSLSHVGQWEVHPGHVHRLEEHGIRRE